MAEDQVEIVADLLARIGGSWYPDRTRTALRVVSDRHREVARLVFETLGRPTDATQEEQTASGRGAAAASFNFAKDDQLYVGATVIYRPVGEKRAITCQVEKTDSGRVFLVPVDQDVGWVPMRTIRLLTPGMDE
ncbi:hypothetical protein [Microvirga sp. TS319]|uniref:hypothetical protein n=1 Tax=Microvirga sp. TS319 TaxID=3241165 RepID=UPI00351A7762